MHSNVNVYFNVTQKMVKIVHFMLCIFNYTHKLLRSLLASGNVGVAVLGEGRKGLPLIASSPLQPHPKQA